MSRSKRRNKRNRGRNTQESVEQAIRRWDDMMATNSGVDVGVRESFSLSAWVYSAVQIITEWMIQNPFVIENHGQIVEDGELYDLVHRPSSYPMQNSCDKFRMAYMIELLLAGAVMRLFPDISGITPSSMIVRPRGDFLANWLYDKNGIAVVQQWSKVSTRGGLHYIPGDTIFHDALYNPSHDFEGLPPLTAALQGINSDINLSELLNRFFENDASTGLIMASSEPVNARQIADATKAWDMFNAGKSRAYATKFIGHGFVPHQIGTSFDASVQQVLRVLTRDEIMNGIFHIPSVIYAGDVPQQGVQIGGTSSDPEKETFLVNVIKVWAKRFDEEFNRDVAVRFGSSIRGYHDFTGNPILERRRLERAVAAAELIDRGVTLNQVIKWLDLSLNTEPHGDEFWIKQGQVPASVIMKMGERAISTAGSTAKKDAKQEYADEIVRIADTVQTKERAREMFKANSQLGGNGNSNRIAKIMEAVQ